MKRKILHLRDVFEKLQAILLLGFSVLIKLQNFFEKFMRTNIVFKTI